MRTQHSSCLPPLFLLTTLVLLLLLHFPTSANSLSTSASSTGPSKSDTEFIRTSCASTRYPKLCFQSLRRYASDIHRNHSKLASVAISVSLSKAKNEATYFSKLSKKTQTRVAAAALKDCISTFGDAVDQHRRSLKQMGNLVAGSGETFRFQMSNVQTWMSAALTNEDTCKDGFKSVGEGTVKKDVFAHVDKVEALTSNALALVNSFAKKRK